MKHISAKLIFILFVYYYLLTCYILHKLIILPLGLRACSHGSGGPRRGKAPDLPVVEKYLSSHATKGTEG